MMTGWVTISTSGSGSDSGDWFCGSGVGVSCRDCADWGTVGVEEGWTFSPGSGLAVELTTAAGVLVCWATGTSLVELDKLDRNLGIALSAVDGALAGMVVEREDSLVISAIGPTKPAVKLELCPLGAVLDAMFGVTAEAGVGVPVPGIANEVGVKDGVSKEDGATIGLLELDVTGLVFKGCSGVLVPGVETEPTKPALCELVIVGTFPGYVLAGVEVLSWDAKVLSAKPNEGVSGAAETGVEVDNSTLCGEEDIDAITLGVGVSGVSIGTEDEARGRLDDREDVALGSAEAPSEDGMTTTG